MSRNSTRTNPTPNSRGGIPSHEGVRSQSSCPCLETFPCPLLREHHLDRLGGGLQRSFPAFSWNSGALPWLSSLVSCRILEVARCSQLTDVGFTTLARVRAPLLLPSPAFPSFSWQRQKKKKKQNSVGFLGKFFIWSFKVQKVWFSGIFGTVLARTPGGICIQTTGNVQYFS